LKPLDKIDLSKVRKKTKVFKKSTVELKNPKSWEKTQGVVTLLTG